MIRDLHKEKVKEERLKVHVLYHSKRWHVCWNLFRAGYRSYAVKFRKDTMAGLSFVLWISFGIGQGSITFYPKVAANAYRWK